VANGDFIASLGKANIPMEVNQQLLHIPCFILPNASFPLILGCDFLRARGITLKFRQESVEIRRDDQTNLKETRPIKMYATNTQVIPAYSQKYIPCVLHNSSDNSLLVAEPNPALYSEKGILIAKSITDSNLLKQYLLVANTTDREVEITNDQYLAELHDVAYVYESNEEIEDCDEINVITTSKIGKREIIPSTLQSREEVISYFKTKLPNLDVNFEPFSFLEIKQIITVILTYENIFDIKQTNYGNAKGVKHTIDTGNARPVNQPPHRTSPAERQIIRDMTNEMLANGVIQPSTSPWASPVVLVKKKDGKQKRMTFYSVLTLLWKEKLVLK
jgi:hypothetical protein